MHASEQFVFLKRRIETRARTKKCSQYWKLYWIDFRT